MKFAFLIHPLSDETKTLLELDPNGHLHRDHGGDLLSFCASLHKMLAPARRRQATVGEPRVRVVDELCGLVSATGARAHGRFYEIPMDAWEILDDPGRAVDYMEKAVDEAAAWGARLVGLGSMTGVVGGHGTHLAARGPIHVTTGNSLTVFAALENLAQLCLETEIDLADETVAVIGIPGSIAVAAARLLAPRCGRLLLVARNASSRAVQLAEQLDAELLLDIPAALAQARVVLSATSSGNCIDQDKLQAGSIIVDVAVPTDVNGNRAIRDDVLILSGGLAKVPPTVPLDSNYLWFHQGMVPSCLAETMVLALDGRAECFSLGRQLDTNGILAIGARAGAHGFDFSRLISFGLPLDDLALVRFRKALVRERSAERRATLPFADPSVSAAAPVAPDASRSAKLHARYLNPVLMAISSKSQFAKTFVRGAGTRLWDADGKEYLDFVAGFGSMNLGHNHPAVAAALTEAIQKQAPGFAQSAVNPYAAALAEKLVSLAPPSLEMAFFANSGTEAVEAALKLARAATGRAGLLHCTRSFHGKSFGSLSVTGNANYQRAFGPLVPECQSITYGDAGALERALASRHFAAFIVEPLQAEGGMYLPPPGYLREAQDLCRAAGTLLIVDEVQTGLGRTGRLFACDHEGVEPDAMTLAKSLGGGMLPIGAMLCRRDLWLKAYGTVQTFALHTSTFGGGSLACAAGLAAMRVIEDERLSQRADRRGEQLRDGLAELCRESNLLAEVRGQGLLVGLEFKPLPAAIAAHWKALDASGLNSYLVANLDQIVDGMPAMYAMQTLLNEHGIYTQVTRSNPRVLRIQPPLTVSAEEIASFLRAVRQICDESEFVQRLFDGVVAKTTLGQHQGGQRTADPVPGRFVA
ncbi:MAG TPA: aminotransferase class III-fold pyridoxal phosphate-dependent enzyme [Pirellulales bacterium]|nr:aminotransferase class III-fold pyridoxal phosphate-dependent enzyme [Pirellulales bacterium]